MTTPDEIIQSWKSMQPKDAFLIIVNSITETQDLAGQILRAHLWAEGLFNGILHQISEDYDKGNFAKKREKLFELGLIDDTHNQELKILNNIRNLYSHNLYPHEQALEEIKKFPTFDQVKMPPELESFGFGVAEMSKFGLISLLLLFYLFGIFWDPKIKN